MKLPFRAIALILIGSAHFQIFASDIPQNKIPSELIAKFNALSEPYACKAIEGRAIPGFDRTAMTEVLSVEVQSAYSLSQLVARENNVLFIELKGKRFADPSLDRRLRMTSWGLPSKVRHHPRFLRYFRGCNQWITMARAYVAPSFTPDGMENSVQLAIEAADWTGGMADLQSLFEQRAKEVPLFILGWINVMTVRDARYTEQTQWGKYVVKHSMHQIQQALKAANVLFARERMTKETHDDVVATSLLAMEIYSALSISR